MASEHGEEHDQCADFGNRGGSPMTIGMDLADTGGWADRRVHILDSQKLSLLVGSVLRWMVAGIRITDRDIAILTWLGRHGVVTPQQVGRRFFVHEGQVAQKRAYRRLAKLEELALIRRDTPFSRHPDVLRLRSQGVAMAESDLPPARYVIREIPHELAVVDLVEELLAKNRGATLQTGREIRRQRVGERTDGKRRVGRGRIPDAVLTLKSGKTAAIELQLRPKRARDDETILEGYTQERFDHVWWYVPESTVKRVRELVKSRRADDLVEVRAGPGPAASQPAVTERDVEVITWIGRYGMVTSAQVANRHFAREGGGTGSRAARNRLTRLESLGLIRRDIPFARHSGVLRLTPAGAELADAHIAPAGWVPAEIAHSLAVVDLMEMLVAEHSGATVTTEREIRVSRGVTGRGRDLGSAGRIPDGELLMKSGKVVAVELDLTPKPSPEIARIIRSYLRSEYDAVWWFVRPGVVDRISGLVRDAKASKLIEVHGWDEG
jgi:Replication-relaxation